MCIITWCGNPDMIWETWVWPLMAAVLINNGHCKEGWTTYCTVRITVSYLFLSCRIIGLFVSVVLVISAFLWSYIAALPSRITFNEIPDPDGLLRLCEDIFYVREDRNHQDEEILVGEYSIFSDHQLDWYSKLNVKQTRTCHLMLSKLLVCRSVLTIIL